MAPLNVVVGITGGIAAYKAVSVVRALVLDGHEVHVVPTDDALRFVGRPTFEAISRNPVTTDLYDGVAEVRHVALGQRADVIVIVPATANTISKLANGTADDLLGNTVLASEAPLVIAPAMHTEMWRHPATQANIATLTDRGAIIIGPATGQLTGTDRGPGRLEEPDVIVRATLDAASGAIRSARSGHDLSGRSIVIAAGGTREPLDPVRFLGNRSSGRQGVALAEAARARGADVTVIAANLEVEAPRDCTIRRVSTALELRAAVLDAARGAAVVIMAAAVADFRPAAVSESKIKKRGSDERLSIELVRNPDILAELGSTEHAGTLLVGFAAETEPDDEQIIALGRRKLRDKRADVLVVNRVGWNEGFSSATNRVDVLTSSEDATSRLEGTKMSVAHGILDVVVSMTPARHAS